MKLRIKFSKHGTMKFIGHLDMMRYFQKAIRRAEVDITYTTGFSPHQVMSFAAPLGVGVESNGEYLDIEVDSLESCEKVQADLNAQMAEGIVIENIIVLPEKCGNAMASVAAARYSISFREGRKPDFSLEEAVAKLMEKQQIVITKETKKNTMEIDIRPYIYELSADEDRIYMLLDASSANNIKPLMVIESLYRLYDQLPGEFDYCITREDTYCLGNKTQPRFIPLDAVTEA